MSSLRQSAGLLMYHRDDGGVKVLIAHPGGPYFENRDLGFWGIPKGEFFPDESPTEAAKREFLEETGYDPGSVSLLPLGVTFQKGGKAVHAWAFEGYWEPGRKHRSNYCEVEWPPGSGLKRTVPEIDKVEMVSVIEARKKMRTDQFVFVERLLGTLNGKKLDLQADKI